MLTTTVVGWAIGFAVIGAGVLALVLWRRNRNIVMKWYDWLIGAIGLFLFLFTVQHVYTSFIEYEPLAAWMGLLVWGLPSLVLFGIVALQIWRRSRAVS